jgi:hypothetical protein
LSLILGHAVVRGYRADNPIQRLSKSEKPKSKNATRRAFSPPGRVMLVSWAYGAGSGLSVRAIRLGLPLMLVAGLLVPDASAAANAQDRTPPTFAGLQSATTCIPGPIGGGQTTSYSLRWDPAADNRTPTGRIVYDVYQASTSGGEDFSSPTYTTPPGATSFATPPLSADKQVYFVVRARDKAGNSDSNTVEREGVNTCV